MAHIIGKTVIVHRDRFAYLSHPSIAVLDDGDWIAGFAHSCRRERRMHPPSDPLFRNLLARSSDRGETWDTPYFAPDFDWSGVEPPGIAQVSEGTVILSQFRFGWYPIALAKKRRAAGEPISLALPDSGWTEEFSDSDWEQAVYPWARGYHGTYFHLSNDGGHCFDTTIKLDTGRFRDGFTRTGVVELHDHRLAYALQEHHPPTARYTYIVFSSDFGKSWSPPAVVHDHGAQAPQFGEPDLAEVAPGEIICILREGRISGHLHLCRSLDSGRSWTKPEMTPIFGYPGHLLVLSDGRLLCTYGRRTAPFGIRACLSEDGGRTWLLDDEIVIRDDLPNGDLGYPTTIEYTSRRLFCCYYGQEPDGVTCVQGTFVELD